MRVAGVILAAGAAARFGSPKQLARVGGRTLLEMVADAAREAGLDPIVAVVPPGLAVPPQTVGCPNDAPAEGISRSLRLGLRAVPSDVDAAVILLGDQPTVEPALIRRMVDGALATTRPIVAALAGGVFGPPVLVRRAAFGLADDVRGDVGLRAVLAANTALVSAVEVGEHPRDVDTPDDLAALDRDARSAARSEG